VRGIGLVALLVIAGPWAIYAQEADAPIRVPVRLVLVPTLVFSPEGTVVSGLETKDFSVLDNGIPQNIELQSENTPPSVAVAIQTNEAVSDYLPFVKRTGALVENLLVCEEGRLAVLTYNNDVTVIKPFGSGDGSAAMKKIETRGTNAHMVDAGLKAVSLLKQEERSRPRVLLLIGQPEDFGSEAKLASLQKSAEEENVTIHCLALPTAGKKFVAETFSLRGKNEDRGGFEASADLTKLVPALRRAGRRSAGEDAFSLLARATGGTQIGFRKQEQLENGLIALGTAIRSQYLLTYAPRSDEAGYHRLSVTVDVSGDKVYSRPGYWARGE
jgi:VWFA-related protein